MKVYNQILASLGVSSPIREGNAAAVYFLGIGGIGMSALARFLIPKG